MPHKHEQLIKSYSGKCRRNRQHFHLNGPLSAKIRQFIKTAISQIKSQADRELMKDRQDTV